MSLPLSKYLCETTPLFSSIMPAKNASASSSSLVCCAVMALRLHLNDVGRGLASHYCLDVSGQEVERLALFGGIERAVIDARDSGLVTGNMIQNGFDDVRQHAKIGHARCDRPAKIM